MDWHDPFTVRSFYTISLKNMKITYYKQPIKCKQPVTFLIWYDSFPPVCKIQRRRKPGNLYSRCLVLWTFHRRGYVMWYSVRNTLRKERGRIKTSWLLMLLRQFCWKYLGNSCNLWHSAITECRRRLREFLGWQQRSDFKSGNRYQKTAKLLLSFFFLERKAIT
jgi:hypothetical protein